MATRITKALKVFFELHQIPLDKVLDAKGMKTEVYRQMMLAGDYWVAIGVTPCTEGHTVKTRSGRCPICKPSTFSFSMRYREPGMVYLAYSRAGGIAKFGYSVNVADRVRQLRLHGCGGQKDWIEVGSFPAENAAEIEESIHRELKPFQVTLAYLHKPGVSRELYRYPLTKSVGVFLRHKFNNEELES